MEQAHPDMGCLHELFERQADRRPADPALAFGGEVLSYQEVEHRANRLARYLHSCGIGRGTLVGLYFARSEKPIIAILGVLKAGAAYVPTDPNCPPERLRHILAEANISTLLTEEALQEQAAALVGGTAVAIDVHPGIAQQSETRLPRAWSGVTPGDLCYVLYTSGSTGRPKGVMTEHRNVVAFVQAFREVCRLDSTDRVYQGFPLGFDGSVEEMWMAFANGAALVVAPDEVVRVGSEVARFLNQNRLTYLSTVPTLLSMIQGDLTTVRLLVVSGEPCPPEAVARWARNGRRMLNVYGPTEATVNTTAEDCRPGKPITIGRPLRGYHTYILDEKMRLVPPGEPGELYVGGAGVARGYLHQEELTAQAFIPNPFQKADGSPRLYKTGDLVRLTPAGDLVFLGRIDSQVKVRGYRIELSEIESVLREHPSVRAAVATVCRRGDSPDLAAYVVPCRPNEGVDRDGILRLLRDRLPRYMIPAYLEVIDEIPLVASGKADRKRLPEPRTPLVQADRQIVIPATELERKITAAWEEVFHVSPISVQDDFFLDLGGYSLLAAQAVSLLRSRLDIEVAIRDLYQHSTIRRLAEFLSTSKQDEQPERCADHARQSRPTSREVFASLPPWTRWSCVAFQAISAYFMYGLAAVPAAIALAMLLAILEGPASGPCPEVAIWVVLAVVFGWFPMLLAGSIALKWLIIGRYKPGRYPLWGPYFFRFWLATRIQGLSGIGLLSGTPVMSLYWRLMGAKVGRNCLIDTPLCGAYDLVTIGDDTCIGAETQLLGYRIEDGMLVLGTIDIGSRCFIGIHSTLGLGCRMEDDARLDDLSFLPDGEVISAGESRRGSPAQPAHVPVPHFDQAQPLHRHPFLFGIIHFVLVELLAVLLIAMEIPPLTLLVVPLANGGLLWAMAALPLAVWVHVTWFCLTVAGLKALILPRLKPGVYQVESPIFLRMWLIQALLHISRALLHPLYTTIYLPSWLRLLGAKIGSRAEISTVSQMVPDLVVIENESFFADGCMIGGRHYYRGHVEVGINRVGRRSFVGNNAILPIGVGLGDRCLLGVLSAPPDRAQPIPDDTEWIGSPAFRLPFRQKVEGFSDAVTYRPTLKLYAQRCAIDALRIFIPNYLAGCALLVFVAFVRWSWFHMPGWAPICLTPPAACGIAAAMALSVISLKRVLIPRFRPVIKPLWCTYVWWNELINGAYETVGAPALAPLAGTPFFNTFLRWMGCKIGRHVYLETALFSEFDLVEIGDYAALNLGVVVQNHLFEDRIMKSSYLRIGDECSVGNMSVILYDTEMKRGASIGPLSLLMKGETVPPLTRWQGIPTSRVAVSAIRLSQQSSVPGESEPTSPPYAANAPARFRTGLRVLLPATRITRSR